MDARARQRIAPQRTLAMTRPFCILGKLRRYRRGGNAKVRRRSGLPMSHIGRRRQQVKRGRLSGRFFPQRTSDGVRRADLSGEVNFRAIKRAAYREAVYTERTCFSPLSSNSAESLHVRSFGKKLSTGARQLGRAVQQQAFPALSGAERPLLHFG